MGEKANRLQRLLDSAYEAEDELLDENTALRQQLHEYKETVEVLEDLCAEMLQGWKQTSVAADSMLQAIGRKCDKYGFAIVEPGSVYVEILADTIYAKPEDVEHLLHLSGLFGSFEPFADDIDDSCACAWSPDFDVDGADDFDLEDPHRYDDLEED